MRLFDFVDAHAMNRQHPTTFHLPDPDDVATLAVGDYVKLGFHHRPTAAYAGPSVERMWVRLTSTAPWAGVLDNEPAFLPHLHLGDEMTGFEAKHFLAILKGKT